MSIENPKILIAEFKMPAFPDHTVSIFRIETQGKLGIKTRYELEEREGRIVVSCSDADLNLIWTKFQSWIDRQYNRSVTNNDEK